MPIYNVAVTSSAGIPNMLPGVSFTAPPPPPIPPVAPPVGVPALGLNLNAMSVIIYGNVRASSGSPGVTVQVL